MTVRMPLIINGSNDHLGICLDNLQQHARRPVGLVSMLLPILQRAFIEPIQQRELGLRKLLLLSYLFDIDVAEVGHGALQPERSKSADRPVDVVRRDPDCSKITGREAVYDAVGALETQPKTNQSLGEFDGARQTACLQQQPMGGGSGWSWGLCLCSGLSSECLLQ